MKRSRIPDNYQKQQSMEKHLRNIVLTLFVFAAGMGIFAQDLPVVKSLSEAFELKKNCKLVIEKDSNCKLQLVSYDTKYDESYVWDGKMAAAYGQHRDFGCYFLVDEDSDNFVVKLEGQETAEELVYDVNAKNDIVSVPLANVTIRNLNLKKDELNTICLPFSVSKEEMDRVFGEGTELYEADSYRSMQDADTIFFKPSTGKTIMTGLPYAIKTTKDVTDPTFRQVTVVAEEPTGTGIFWEDNKSLSTKYVRMMGSYSKTTFNPVSYIFINGTLTDAKIINTTEMGGFACQITAEEELKRLAAFINNQLVTDGIAEIEQERQASVRIYNLNGQYVGESPDKLGRGVYVVNGQKVVINK